MQQKTNNPDNTWPTLNFLKALEHPVFRYTLETLLIVVDRGGHIVFTNRAFQASSGFSENELMDEHFCILFPELQREPVSARFFEQLDIGVFDNNFVIPLCNKAGEPFYIHWITATLTDSDGAIEYIIGTGVDSTETRNTFINYEISHKRFQDLVETSSDWMWETDADLHFTYSSPQIETILGYRPEEIIGKTAFVFSQGDKAINFTQLLISQMEKAAPINCFLNYKCHKDGHVVTMETSCVPYISDQGELLGYRGIERNITDRQNTLQALKKSEERLRLSQKCANIGNWEWDIITGDLYWSDQHWALFGLPAKSFEPSYERFLESIHPDDRDTVIRAIEDSHHHGITYDVEHRIVWPNGEIHWVRGTGNVDYDSHGKPARMLGVISNIDQHKYIEYNQLRQAEQQRNALIREVHHSIKNNLQGIVGLLRNSLKNKANDPRVAVEDAITQVNAIAHIHGIQGRRDGKELLLCEMIPAIVKGHMAQNQDVGEINLSLKIENSLQLLDKEAVPVALIINELITNALKHANKKKANDKISVSLHVVNDRGEISIHCPGGRLPDGFDFQAGTGYGTGLELIRALLPPEGMSIQYRQTQSGVTTDVLLQAPIVRHCTLSEQEYRPKGLD